MLQDYLSLQSDCWDMVQFILTARLYIHQTKLLIINETQTPPLWIWFAQFLLNDMYAMKRVSVLVGGNHTINQRWMFRE